MFIVERKNKQFAVINNTDTDNPIEMLVVDTESLAQEVAEGLNLKKAIEECSPLPIENMTKISTGDSQCIELSYLSKKLKQVKNVTGLIVCYGEKEIEKLNIETVKGKGSEVIYDIILLMSELNIDVPFDIVEPNKKLEGRMLRV